MFHVYHKRYNDYVSFLALDAPIYSKRGLIIDNTKYSSKTMIIIKNKNVCAYLVVPD